MIEELDKLFHDATEALATAPDETAVRTIEVQYLGKKGAVTRLLKGMGQLSAEERPRVGKRANEV